MAEIKGWSTGKTVSFMSDYFTSIPGVEDVQFTSTPPRSRSFVTQNGRVFEYTHKGPPLPTQDMGAVHKVLVRRLHEIHQTVNRFDMPPPPPRSRRTARRTIQANPYARPPVAAVEAPKKEAAVSSKKSNGLPIKGLEYGSTKTETVPVAQ